MSNITFSWVLESINVWLLCLDFWSPSNHCPETTMFNRNMRTDDIHCTKSAMFRYRHDSVVGWRAEGPSGLSTKGVLNWLRGVPSLKISTYAKECQWPTCLVGHHFWWKSFSAYFIDGKNGILLGAIKSDIFCINTFSMGLRENHLHQSMVVDYYALEICKLSDDPFAWFWFFRVDSYIPFTFHYKTVNVNLFGTMYIHPLS